MNARPDINMNTAAKAKGRYFKPNVTPHADIDVEKAAKLWSEGKSMDQIAMLLRTNKYSVRTLTLKNRDLFPKRQRAESDWTDAKIKEAARMWADGMSPAEIGKKFHSTKGGIIGLAYRNRDLFPARGTGRKTAEGKPRRSVTIIPKAKQKRMVEPDFGPAEPQIPATEYDLMRLPHAKSLIDLEPCECKWPLTSGGPFMFCAETTESRASYCTNHLERSLPRPEHRRLKAAA